MLFTGLMFAISVVALLSGYFLWQNTKQLQLYKKQAEEAQNQLVLERTKQADFQLEFSELQSKLSNSFLSDPLTGLPSRKIFEDRVKLALNQSSRYQLIFAVMFLDLDGFKIINDALGHHIGDELLQEVANRLQYSIRQVDTVSRFAGDEFVFLLPQIAKAETAAYIAQRFIDIISPPFRVRDEELYITASIGIATYPADGEDVQTLLTHATNALHQAKSFGRNMYQFYQKEMQSESRRELILSSGLRSDLLYQEFLLYFQPEVNVETKTVSGMTAMLCWQHGDCGIIPWNAFSKLAENSGRIVAIGEWVLRNACQYFLSWQKQNFHPASIAIQTTLKQIENSHFIQKLTNVLQEFKIEPHHITLEISELSLIGKTDLMEKMLHMFKHLGVRIFISNFGVGYLSLQHLRSFPIDGLKIDGSLVRDITINKESEAIVKMIIALAKSLQLEIVADGVEMPKQQQLLQSLGCQRMQGTLFGSPMLATELTEAVTQKISEII